MPCVLWCHKLHCLNLQVRQGNPMATCDTCGKDCRINESCVRTDWTVGTLLSLRLTLIPRCLEITFGRTSQDSQLLEFTGCKHLRKLLPQPESRISDYITKVEQLSHSKTRLPLRLLYTCELTLQLIVCYMGGL